MASLVQGSDGAARATARSTSCPPDALLYAHVERRPARATSGAARDEIVRQLPALCAACATRRSTASRAAAARSTSRRRSGPGSATRRRSRCCARPDRADLTDSAQRPDRRFARSVPRGRGHARASSVYRGVDRARVRRPRGRLHRRLPRGRPARERARRDRRAPPATRSGGRRSSARRVDKLDAQDPLAYAYAPARRRRAGCCAAARADRPIALRLARDAGGSRPPRAVGARGAHTGSALDLAYRAPARRRRRATFRPTLIQEVPAEHDRVSWARAGLDGVLDRSCSASAERQGAALPGLVARLRRQLGPSGERALVQALGPLLGRESALFVTPPVNLPVVTLVVADTTVEEGGQVLVVAPAGDLAAAGEPGRRDRSPTHHPATDRGRRTPPR